MAAEDTAETTITITVSEALGIMRTLRRAVEAVEIWTPESIKFDQPQAYLFTIEAADDWADELGARVNEALS